jgi:hypothetical protein
VESSGCNGNLAGRHTRHGVGQARGGGIGVKAKDEAKTEEERSKKGFAPRVITGCSVNGLGSHCFQSMRHQNS